jgi:hypothetical protein
MSIASVWTSSAHVSVYRYSYSKLEMHLAPGLDRNSAADMRAYGNVQIHTERMDNLVRTALKEVEKSMKKGAT